MSKRDATLRVVARLDLGSFHLDADFESNVPVLAIFGPSGAGKTTLLNVIAGLRRPPRALIRVGDRVLNDTDAGVFVPPHKRRIAVVFQDAQLFPHLSVEHNINFPRWFGHGRDAALPAGDIVQSLGIGHLMKRRPTGLSGGERQRVALARALMAEPNLLLMDEPLASLDEERRDEILTLIERVRDVFGIPICYVTHRRDEVDRLAQQTVHIDRGRTRPVAQKSA